MEKTTKKQIFVGGLLATYEKGANCYQVIKDHSKALKSEGISVDKINSVNATLASLATKGLATKSKVAYNDKMVTLYLATQKLIDLLESQETQKESK